MPSASEFSTSPDANTTIGGTNVGENCSPGGLNNAIRYIAAVVRTLYDQVQGLAGAMPTTGGAFTGDITRQGRGGYLHHANSAQTAGQVHFLPDGSARPGAAEGVVVFYYAS